MNILNPIRRRSGLHSQIIKQFRVCEEQSNLITQNRSWKNNFSYNSGNAFPIYSFLISLNKNYLLILRKVYFSFINDNVIFIYLFLIIVTENEMWIELIVGLLFHIYNTVDTNELKPWWGSGNEWRVSRTLILTLVVKWNGLEVLKISTINNSNLIFLTMSNECLQNFTFKEIRLWTFEMFNVLLHCYPTTWS